MTLMQESAPTPRSSDPRVNRLVLLFEALSPGDLSRLGDVYSADAQFKDPFNEVRGVPAIRAVFEHMYVALDRPRFVVRDVVVQDDQCLLTWDFLFHLRRFNSQLQTVRGASHLKFDAEGLITVHRDYWDVAEELYEKLPGVGSVMRWLKRRANS
jgi:ketosteroid isomerase-like protein